MVPELLFFFFCASTHTVPQSFNTCLKNDRHSTTLVCEIHGLFELLFLFTTNKYLCQCLACTSVRSSQWVFHMHCWHMSQSKNLLLDSPSVFFLMAPMSEKALFRSSMPRLTSLFCCECVNICANHFGMTFNEFRLETFMWLHMHSWQAESQITYCRLYLKGRNLHLTSELTLYCLCVLQKSQWSAPQLWWAAQRNQQVSICSAHLAHKHHSFTRGTKTYFLIFLDLGFKVWNKY